MTTEILEWLKKYVKINNPMYLDESAQLNFEEISWVDPHGRIQFDLDINNVTIAGDLENFNLIGRGHRIKFARFSGFFQVRDCPNLVDLSGIPEEIYSDTDSSALFVQNCKSLKTWDESYCPDGAPHLRISNCDNLHTITLASEYDNLVEIFDLKSLTNFVSKGADKGLEIYIDNCEALDPKNIDLMNPDPMSRGETGKIWVDNCKKLECEVKGMEFEVFNKIKHSKNLQKGKDLGLF